MSGPITLLIAICAGAAAMYGVHFLMQSLYRLRHDGTAQIHRTMGERGTVYVPIPPNNEGLGKIQIRTQGRIMEYAARTRGPNKLRTGTTVEVVEIVSPMTVEVEPVDAAVRPCMTTSTRTAWRRHCVIVACAGCGFDRTSPCCSMYGSLGNMRRSQCATLR